MDTGTRQLHRSCRARVRALHRLGVLDVAKLHRYLERIRRRPIRLVPLDRLDPDAPCGLWVVTRDEDFVLYGAAASPLHRTHIVAHEFAHILCEHAGLLGGEQAPVLLPHVSAATIERILGRSNYSQREEQEAEILASMIVQSATRRSAAQPVEPMCDAEESVVSRLRALLE